MARFLPGDPDPELTRRLAELVLLGLRLPEYEAHKLAKQHGCSARSVYRSLKALRSNLTTALEAASTAEQARADTELGGRHLAHPPGLFSRHLRGRAVRGAAHGDSSHREVRTERALVRR